MISIKTGRLKFSSMTRYRSIKFCNSYDYLIFLVKIDIVGITTIDFLYSAIYEYRPQGIPALQSKQINCFTLAFFES